LIAGLGLAAAPGAGAATFTVMNANDSGAGSLRQAILDASGSPGADIIVFDASLAGQTITLTSDSTYPNLGTTFGPTALVINIDNITIDGSAASGLSISGNSARRVFAVTPGATLALKNLTITAGKALGGAGGTFPNMGGGGGGGAGLGGAVWNNGTLSAVGVTFTSNTAQGGAGGDYVAGSGNPGGGGGGFGTAGGNATTTVAGVGALPGGNGSLSGNGSPGAFGGGGGGAGGPSGNGGAGGFGGGGGGGAVSGSGYGAGGFGGGSDPGHDGPGGGGAGLGGAIFNNGGILTLTNSTLTANSAIGGASTSGAGQGYGGAIFNRNGTLTVLNCTISLNTAAAGARGIYNLGDAATALASINNTIIGQNSTTPTDFVGSTINAGTSTTSGVGNLIRARTGFAGTVAGTADPLLAALAANGGPTKTLLPGLTSPVRNAGNAAAAAALTVDQRGQARFSGGQIDIGSVQATPSTTATTTTLAASPNPSTFGASVTFTATVAPSAASGTVTFKDGVTTLGTGTLSGGQATYATSALTAGSHSITAEYAGDSSYSGSTSAPLSQVVTALPATRTWTGAGANANWTTADNWGGTAPAAGDTLVVPASAVAYIANNDFAADTRFDSIQIGSDSYTFSGNAIQLDNGITTTHATGIATLPLGITLTAPQTVTVGAGVRSLLPES
jgi:hypothetical protein